MLKRNEKGRSMIEMLGVLTIIGVLSVGGLHVINRMQDEQKSTRMVSELSELARYAKKMACQYDSGYSDYTIYLYKQNAYPGTWSFDKQNTKFTGVLGTTYSISSADGKLTVTVGKLPEEFCMRLATSDWGGPQSSGFLSISLNNDETPVKANSAQYPMSFEAAATKCNKKTDNVIYLVYQGCI